MLKLMLCKFVEDDPGHWDALLLDLLFAVQPLGSDTDPGWWAVLPRNAWAAILTWDIGLYCLAFAEKSDS